MFSNARRVAPLAAMSLLMLTAPAPASDRFDCGGTGITITLVLEPETNTATLVSPRGTDRLSLQGDGAWRDASQELQFFAAETPPRLWMGSEQFSCRPLDAGNQMTVNAAGRSLGGRLRNGPGMEHAPVGSLAEGTPVTIIANTGVRFDGYDWFEIRAGNGTVAYQWGGIMCSQGRPLAGIYQQCAE